MSSLFTFFGVVLRRILLKPAFVLTAVSVGSLSVVLKQQRDTVDRVIMSLVRDVARYKAKKRRHKTTKGIVAYFASANENDPLQDIQDLLPSEDNKDNDLLRDLPIYTPTELYEYGNGYDSEDLLISIFGRIYNVSTGSKFYGPVGPYSSFAGRDVTYSLCTGCRTESCLTTSFEDFQDMVNDGTITKKQLKEGQKWLSFFHLHDKYPLTGKLEVDYLETLLLQEDFLAGEPDKEGGGKPLKPPIF